MNAASKINTTINPSRLRQRLIYYPESGNFLWLPRPIGDFHCARRDREFVRWNGVHAAKPAFEQIDANGYRVGRVDGIRLKAHRVAWAYWWGEWPIEIDHINRDRTDNRIENLRVATRSQNNANKAKRIGGSKYVGVHFHKKTGKWVASIGIKGRNKHLGLFANEEDAAVAFNVAAIKVHGEFAVLNTFGDGW